MAKKNNKSQRKYEAGWEQAFGSILVGVDASTNDHVEETMIRKTPTKNELKALSQDTISEWLDEVDALRESLPGANRPDWTSKLLNLREAIFNERITVCFGGHYNAGKSTLVNGATNRPILSVDELPETGVVCRIMAGTKDEAYLRKGNRRAPVECSPSGIRAVTALQPNLERRPNKDLVDELWIQLDRTRIPKNTCWIDPPGVDDKEEMTMRAKNAASDADVLIYVSATRQPLSDGETAFVADHVANHGPASVVMAFNAILKADNAKSWSSFQQRNVPFLTQRVAERHEEMGFSDEVPLAWYPVSARALAEGDGALLGGNEFLDMLLAIKSASHPRVQRTRVFGASRQLAQLADTITDRQKAVARQVEENERKWKQEYDVAEKARKDFRRGVETAVGEFLADLGRRIGGVGSIVRGNVGSTQSGVSLSSILDHDRDWNLRSRTAVGLAFDAFETSISLAVKRHGQVPLTSDSKTQLRSAIAAPTISIMGYRDDLDDVGNGAAAAVVAAGGLGTLLVTGFTFGLGTGVAVAATAAAAATARSAAIENAASEAQRKIRGDIDKKTNDAATALHSKRSSLVELVMQVCARSLSGPEKDTEGRAESKALTELATRASSLAENAHSMATR